MTALQTARKNIKKSSPNGASRGEQYENPMQNISAESSEVNAPSSSFFSRWDCVVVWIHLHRTYHRPDCHLVHHPRPKILHMGTVRETFQGSRQAWPCQVCDAPDPNGLRRPDRAEADPLKAEGGQ